MTLRPSNPKAVTVLIVCILLAGIAPASIGTVDGSVASVDTNLYPESIEISDDEQTLALDVSDLPESDRIEVVIDVTPLATEGNVTLGSLAADEAETEFYNADLVDADVASDGDRVLVRLTLAPEDDRFRGTVTLTGFDADDAEHAEGLTYRVALAEEGAADPADSVESRAFDVIDPHALDPEPELGALRIDLGDESQHLKLRVQDLPAGTERVEAVVDVTPLAEAGVDLSDAGIDVNERVLYYSELDRADVDRSGDRIHVTLAVDVVEETNWISISFDLTGIDTAGVEPTGGLSYDGTVSVDEDEFDAESSTFEVRDPARYEPPTAEETPTPDQSSEDDEDAPGPHGGEGSDADAETTPGFGVTLAVGTLLAVALLARRRA